MARYLLLVRIVICLLPYRWSVYAEVVCPPSAQKVISYDTKLLPPSAIAASSEDEANPADQLFGRNNVPFNLWCTAPETGSHHQINVSFTEPVVITAIVSSGFANGYVTDFAVEYWPTSPPDGVLPYKLYHVPEIDAVFLLQDNPLTAQWLRLGVQDGVIAPSGRLCWHLTLLGCKYTDAIQVQPGSTQPHTTINSTPLLSSQHSYSTLPQPTSSPLPTDQVGEEATIILTVTEVVRDNRMLTIAVPTAVCAVLLTLVIVTIGVVLCLKQGRGADWRRSSREFSKIPSTETLRVLDNTTLYGQTSTPTYSPSLKLVQVLPNNHRPSHLDLGDALYENQPSPPPPGQEPHPYEAVTPTKCTAQRTNSMVDNPTYNVPFHPPSPTLPPPPPPPPDSPIKPPRIDLVNNECYSLSESYANYDEDLDYCSTGNIYETPQ